MPPLNLGSDIVQKPSAATGQLSKIQQLRNQERRRWQQEKEHKQIELIRAEERLQAAFNAKERMEQALNGLDHPGRREKTAEIEWAKRHLAYIQRQYNDIEDALQELQQEDNVEAEQ